MITIYELERSKPLYFGLCGAKAEKMIYVRVFELFDYNHHLDRLNRLTSSGWRLKKKRTFPTKKNKGGFMRLLN